ncbi:ACP S-malonyltransferase [Streptomyces sp. NPDC052109]|uniref:ACP S-malonyltransferase n=1 Tax=Streptomyces sp. NPDC052109 TaxID=3155527 RepID=UPI00343DCDB1
MTAGTPDGAPPTAPYALLFPGQGSQQPHMGGPWRETPQWRIVDDIARHSGMDVEHALLRADAETLRRTDLAQISVYAVSMMALTALRDRWPGLPVAACAGHSLGEYSALAAAGVVSVADGARLVAARGTAMREAVESGPGTMGAVVGGTAESVRELVAAADAAGTPVWLANENAPGQTVVSGSAAGVDAVADAAPEHGMKVIRLAVAGAFHSPLMEPARAVLRRACATVVFRDAHTPVVANVDARAHLAGDDWRALIDRQMVGPVLWERSVRTITDELGCRSFIELGPGKTLAGMVRRIDKGARVACVNTPDDLQQSALAPAAV